MKLIFKISIVVLLYIQVLGCTTQVYKSSATLEQSKEISVLFTQGGAVSGFIKGMLMPIGTTKTVTIITVNGEKIKAKKNSKNKEFWLTPGTHEIKINCTIQVDSRFYDGKESIKYDFKAGKEYLLDAYIPNVSINNCRPRVLEG